MADLWSLIIFLTALTGDSLVVAEICYTTYSMYTHDRYTVDCEHGCCGYYYYRTCCSDPTVPLIIGCVVGGICFLVGIAFVICLCFYCTKRPHRLVVPAHSGSGYHLQQNMIYQQQMSAIYTPFLITDIPNEPPPAYTTGGQSSTSLSNTAEPDHQLPEKY